MPPLDLHESAVWIVDGQLQLLAFAQTYLLYAVAILVVMVVCAVASLCAEVRRSTSARSRKRHATRADLRVCAGPAQLHDLEKLAAQPLIAGPEAPHRAI